MSMSYEFTSESKAIYQGDEGGVKKMGKIHISISGGALESVYSDNPGDDVTLWDWDNIVTDPECDPEVLQKEWKETTKELHQIL